MPPISRPISTGGLPIEKLALTPREVSSRPKALNSTSAGRADRVSLRDRLGRIADRVELVGDVADLVGQVGHLGDPAGVVGDRAESVERDDQATQGKLGHDRDTDAIDAVAQLPGAEDPQRDHDHRSRGRLVALGQARDDVGRVAGLTGTRRSLS